MWSFIFYDFKKEKISIVINLAAQAGVRYAFKNPDSYIKSNVVGFTNLISFVKDNNIKKLIFASTSSVYGDIKTFPWSESDKINSPFKLCYCFKYPIVYIFHCSPIPLLKYPIVHIPKNII